MKKILILLTIFYVAYQKKKSESERTETFKRATASNQDLPDASAFSINMLLKTKYNTKDINFNMRIHIDNWGKDSFMCLMSPSIMEIHKYVTLFDPKNEEDFTDYDILQSVKLSMFQSLFTVLKFFEIKEEEFPTPPHLLRAMMNFVTAKNIKETQFDLMIKHKDDVGIKLTVVLDQIKVKKFIESCGVFDEDTIDDPAFLEQFNDSDAYISKDTVDLREMIMKIPQHILVSTFSQHAKGYFQSLRDPSNSVLSFMCSLMDFNLITGFDKMVEENLEDDFSDPENVKKKIEFGKVSDFNVDDKLPLDDFFYNNM